MDCIAYRYLVYIIDIILNRKKHLDFSGEVYKASLNESQEGSLQDLPLPSLGSSWMPWYLGLETGSNTFPGCEHVAVCE